MNWNLIRRLAAASFFLLILSIAWPDIHRLILIVYNYAYWTLYSRCFHVLATMNASGPLAIASDVPRILHQTWKTLNIPEAWREAQQSCIKHHKKTGYEYRLWTDEDSELLIATNYSWFLHTYMSYPYDIQRVDASRYFILHQHGGIYLDLDIFCLASLEALRGARGGFLAPKTHPIGVSNDLLVSSPRHPFVTRLINNLGYWKQGFFILKYTKVMFSTGPMFVTVQLSIHGNKSDADILAPELYGKYSGIKGAQGHQKKALVKHLKGSSWHGNDAWVFLFLDKNGSRYLVIAASVSISTLIVGVILKRSGLWDIDAAQLSRTNHQVKEV